MTNRAQPAARQSEGKKDLARPGYQWGGGGAGHASFVRMASTDLTIRGGSRMVELENLGMPLHPRTGLYRHSPSCR